VSSSGIFESVLQCDDAISGRHHRALAGRELLAQLPGFVGYRREADLDASQALLSCLQCSVQGLFSLREPGDAGFGSVHCGFELLDALVALSYSVLELLDLGEQACDRVACTQ
jgi:hypothetical protein